MRIGRGHLVALLLVLQTLYGHAASATDAPLSLPPLDRVTVLPAPKQIPDFTLIDHTGRPRSFSSLRGAPTLVFFGFTHCPDVCPAAMTKLKVMHRSGDPSLKAVHVVMISVDGERDTPDVMKKYVASFSPDFVGLTGKPRAVSDIAAQFAAVAFKEPVTAAGSYGFFHSSQVFLVDGRGRLRASFADASVDNIAAMTQRLLKEKVP